MTQQFPRLSLQEALAQVLEPRGKVIADVGCGDGAVVRHLTKAGASVTGIEISEEQLARARQAGPAGSEVYRVASGERLPFGDGAIDAVLYINSFHHVSANAMEAALGEAARVLRVGGRLVVIEPLAAGDHFEAVRLLEDETEVRAAAYRTLQSPPPSLRAEGELLYETAVRFRDADHFLAAVAAVDPRRRERLPPVEEKMRRSFTNAAQRDEKGLFIVSLMRRNLFRRIG